MPDNPPFSHPGRLARTVANWQPLVWPVVFEGSFGPYQPRRLSPSIASLVPRPDQVVRNVIIRCRLVTGNNITMHTIRDFDVADPEDDQFYGIDFVNDLADGDSIASANVLLTLKSGDDPDPSSHLGSSAFVLGTIVEARIMGLIAGNVYTLQIVAATTLGDRVSLWANIPCQPVF